MPEGDTVWLTARRLDQALSRRTVTTFDLRVPQVALVDLRGDVVNAVVARGKHILMRFASGQTLHSHLRMDGSWYLSRAGSRPGRHPEHMIRALVGNDEWLAVGYRVHDLRLVSTRAEDEVVGHLGPDLLGPDWDEAEALRRLRAQPERPICEALLDQTKLAGIGNMYQAEVLFLAGVHPTTRVAEVPDLESLPRIAHRLLRANRDHPEQSTTGRLGRGQEHWVYLRGGQPCRRCGTAIVTGQHGVPPRQRPTWWCPTCQPDVAVGPVAGR